MGGIGFQLGSLMILRASFMPRRSAGMPVLKHLSTAARRMNRVRAVLPRRRRVQRAAARRLARVVRQAPLPPGRPAARAVRGRSSRVHVPAFNPTSGAPKHPACCVNVVGPRRAPRAFTPAWAPRPARRAPRRTRPPRPCPCRSTCSRPSDRRTPRGPRSQPAQRTSRTARCCARR